MAVNLSTRQIAERDLVSDVDDALRIRDSTQRVWCWRSPRRRWCRTWCSSAADRLIELRRLGARIAVDDFGVGYASLGYLRQFPIDILKIDKSFIDTINERDGLPAIVRGVLDLGKTLGLEIVAEGIEHAVQRDELREGLCDLGQGYLFALRCRRRTPKAFSSRWPAPRRSTGYAICHLRLRRPNRSGEPGGKRASLFRVAHPRRSTAG